MALIKTFSFLFAFLFLVSCGKGGSSANAVTDSFTEDNEAESRDASGAVIFDVNTVMFGFSSKQEEKILQAAELIKKIVISDVFKKKVLNYTYNGKKTFVDNGGLSNKQVYLRILKGAEKMTNLGNNRTMDLEIELYTDLESNTIGYTYPNIVRIFMNRKYFNKFQPYQVADNMMHEWLHKLGFKHEVEATPSRRHSIPYAVGYIIKNLARTADFQ